MDLDLGSPIVFHTRIVDGVAEHYLTEEDQRRMRAVLWEDPEADSEALANILRERGWNCQPSGRYGSFPADWGRGAHGTPEPWMQAWKDALPPHSKIYWAVIRRGYTMADVANIPDSVLLEMRNFGDLSLAKLRRVVPFTAGAARSCPACGQPLS